MPARMKDIAEALNVSIVTVSKVLNNHPGISAATRQRVIECAQRLDYRINLAARGLVTGQSKMIGLIVPDLFHGFFSEVEAGMSDFLRPRSYGLIISSSRDNERLEQEEVRQMLSRGVDALVVATCELKVDRLRAAVRDTPLILVDRRAADRAPGHIQDRFVGTDDLLAGTLATQHLVDIGRRRIAYISGPDFSPSHDREQAYRAVLARAKITVPESYIVRLPQNEENSHVIGMQAMKKLLALKRWPDAVFCYNDPVALGVMMAILEAGLRIPDDIAIVGCGNTFHNPFLRVPLTSVDQSAARIGQQAADLALRTIAEQKQTLEDTPTAILIEPKLVIRESTVKLSNP